MPIFNFHSWSSLLNTSSQLVILRWSPEAAYIGTVIAGERREGIDLRNRMLQHLKLASAEERREEGEEISLSDGADVTDEEDGKSLNSDCDGSSLGDATTRGRRKIRKVKKKSRSSRKKSSKSHLQEWEEEERPGAPFGMEGTVPSDIFWPAASLLLGMGFTIMVNAQLEIRLKQSCFIGYGFLSRFFI